MKTIEELRFLLTPFFKHSLDCDGQSLIFSRVLSIAGIEHKVKCGTIINRKSLISFPYHEWIEINNLMVDFKARKWFQGNIPHGVFLKSDCQDLFYTTKFSRIDKSKIPLSVVKILFEKV